MSAERDPFRLHPLRIAPWMGERCDGCGAAIQPSTEIQIRADGALFCTMACALVHDGIPIDTSKTHR